MLSVIGIALAVALAVIIPAFFITKQEIAIEGPFGWSALTFTRRFSTKSWISKIYQSYSGKDKWATEYHLSSNAIWLSMYLIPLVYVLCYTKVVGIFDLKAFVCVVALALASNTGLNVTEDYLWFLIHPYFGPGRMTSDYIPWHENFKAEVPVANWKGVFTSIIMVGVVAILTHVLSIFITWIMAVAFIIVFCLGIRQWSKKGIKRKDLAKFWWKKIKYVLIKRALYPSENPGLDIQEEVEAYVIPEEVGAEIIFSGTAIPLEEALALENN